MKTWNLYWAPDARAIATVQAKTSSAAKRKAPYPYRKFLGEIRAEEAQPPARRRLNIYHRNGGMVVDIVAVGHATYHRRAHWFFKAKVEWADGSHTRNPEDLYEVAPFNLAYPSNEDQGDVPAALDAMNAYLKKYGRWDQKGMTWVPYEKQGEEAVTL